MTEQTKTYFHQMYEEVVRYERAKAEREKEKKALIAANDWDAVDAWYKHEKKFPKPYTDGQMQAYWAFAKSSEIEAAELEVADAVWEREVKDFSGTLRAAGVTAFVLTDRSTALMENIHWLEAEGWHLVGTCKLQEKEYGCGKYREVEHLGLRFEIEKEA